jgi:lactate dehydrogenase-like 2-hydroxyacid dehydrogenase
MTEKAVLVASPFLLDRRAAWDEGYEIFLPSDAADPVIAGRIRAIVTGGDALDNALVDALPNLGLVACFSTGYAGIDHARLAARGIALTTAAGVNAHDVADHAIALFLALWHGIPQNDRAVRAGLWRGGRPPRPSLRGKRAGIVGLGRIGVHIADRAAALGMKVCWWGPRPKPDAPYARAESLTALADWSDALFIASLAIAENAGQIDQATIGALGPAGVLVNVSRGFLVDEPALIAALRDNTIGGAALDVFGEEPTDPACWAGLDNVVLAPHLAGYTREAGADMVGQLRENLRRFFAGEALLSPVGLS